MEYRVDHSQLACSYHAGIVAGLALITRNLEQSWTIKVPVNILHSTISSFFVTDVHVIMV